MQVTEVSLHTLNLLATSRKTWSIIGGFSAFVYTSPEWVFPLSAYDEWQENIVTDNDETTALFIFRFNAALPLPPAPVILTVRTQSDLTFSLYKYIYIIDSF